MSTWAPMPALEPVPDPGPDILLSGLRPADVPAAVRALDTGVRPPPPPPLWLDLGGEVLTAAGFGLLVVAILQLAGLHLGAVIPVPVTVLVVLALARVHPYGNVRGGRWSAWSALAVVATLGLVTAHVLGLVRLAHGVVLVLPWAVSLIVLAAGLCDTVALRRRPAPDVVAPFPPGSEALAIITAVTTTRAHAVPLLARTLGMPEPLLMQWLVAMQHHRLVAVRRTLPRTPQHVEVTSLGGIWFDEAGERLRAQTRGTAQDQGRRAST